MAAYQPWTLDEIDDAHRLDYEAFKAIHPDRTFDSWRIKRGRSQPIKMLGRTDDIPTPVRLDRERDGDWESLFDSLEQASARRGDLGESTKSVWWEPDVDGPVAVAFISDVHAGAGGVDYQRFRSDLETVQNTEGLYAIFNGDALENTKTHSKSSTALYTAAFANPREQLEYIRRRFAICQNKWVAILSGNHDAFDYRTAGIDRLAGVASELGVPYGTEAGATITAVVGTQRYALVVKHDHAGKSRLNTTNSQRRLFDEWAWADGIDADVVALAHLHEPDLHTTMRRGRDVVYLRSGTYKIRDDWAESKGYRPCYGVPVVILNPDTRKIVAFHGLHFTDAVQTLTNMRQAWEART